MDAIRRVSAFIDRVSDAIARTVDTSDRVRLWVAVVGGWRAVVAIVGAELVLLLVAIARLAAADVPDTLGPLIAAVVIPVIATGYARYRWRRFLDETAEPPEPPEVAAYSSGVREYIPNNVRFQVLQRDGFRCVYCGRTPQDGARLELDHLHPVSAGGTSDPANLVTACFDCNRSKAARMIIN